MDWTKINEQPAPAASVRRLSLTLLVRFVGTAALAAALPTSLLSAGAAADTGLFPATKTSPEAVRYELLQVVSPQQDETVHDNAGHVPVKVDLAPPLRASDGHWIRVVLDESTLRGAWRTTQFSLQGIDRGRHTLRVVVVDANDRHLIQSKPVVFNVWQASRLFSPPDTSP